MKIRKAHSTDRGHIARIYRDLEGKVEGITRRPEEITETYVFTLLNQSEDKFIVLVMENDEDEIIGFVHGEKVGLAIYDHILTNFTVVVKPDYQGKGIGQKLFIEFLDHIKNNRPDIKRLEMEVRYNVERIEAFKGIQFIIDATIKERARDADGTFYDMVLMAWETPQIRSIIHGLSYSHFISRAFCPYPVI